MMRVSSVNQLKTIIFLCSIISCFIGCAPTMKDFQKLQLQATSEVEEERVDSVRLMGKISDADPVIVLPSLYRILKSDASAEVRKEAANSLMNLGFGEASSVLAESLKSDDSPEVRGSCAKGIYKLENHEAEDELIDCAQNDSAGSVRSVCVEHLGKIGGAEAFEVVRGRLGQDPDSTVRARAALALGEMRDLSALSLLKNAVLNDDARNVRKSALLSIGKIPGKDAIDFLVQSLDMKEYQDTVIEAVHANNRHAESTELITKLMLIVDADPGAIEDERIIRIFLNSGDNRSKPYMRKYILHPDSSRDTIRLMAKEMKRRNDTSMAPRLISDLRTNDRFLVQLNIVTALANLGDPAAVPVLINMLRNKDRYHNCLPTHLVAALHVLNDPGSAGYLCELCCNEPDKKLRYEACRASSHIVLSNYRAKLPDCPCWNK